MKIVINARYGLFGLSHAACVRARELGLQVTLAGERHEDGRGFSDSSFLSYSHDYRADPRLVQVVEELGEAANSNSARLKVVEIPDGVEWHLMDYNGWESIHEDHRSWG
jgi:hypothetical protein